MEKNACCFIAHRPQKLPWRFDEQHPHCMALKEILLLQVKQMITHYEVRHFITTMQRGVGTYAAEMVLELRDIFPITLECAIAFEEQTSYWLEDERNRFFSIIERADREVLLQKPFTDGCFRRQNRYLVDQCQFVIAVWNGQPGGTGDAVGYAVEKHRHVIRIDPFNLDAPSGFTSIYHNPILQ